MDEIAGVSRRRLVGAAVLGNIFEFYDFTSYAFFAVMIGATFFPSDIEGAATLLSLAVFGVGFVTRPLGSIFIGRYADRAGRRPALLLTVNLMAIGTAMIAFTPGYASIGIAAPIIIVMARLLQGAALGGELGPATVYLFEVSSRETRGLWTSWQPASQGIATFLAGISGVLLATTLSNEDLFEWGWRIPFVAGLAILPIGLYLRRNLPETLGIARRHSQELRRQTDLAVDARLLFSIFTQIGFGTVSIYVCTFMTTFSIDTLGFSPGIAFYNAMVIGASVFAGSLIGGWASDHLPRLLVVAAPRCVLAVMAIPVFGLVIDGRTPGGLLALSFLLPFCALISGGATFAAIIDVLPVDLRTSQLGISYALVVALLGGTAQFAVMWLIGATGDVYIPAYYLIAISLLSLATLPWLKKPSGSM